MFSATVNGYPDKQNNMQLTMNNNLPSWEIVDFTMSPTDLFTPFLQSMVSTYQKMQKMLYFAHFQWNNLRCYHVLKLSCTKVRSPPMFRTHFYIQILKCERHSWLKKTKTHACSKTISSSLSYCVIVPEEREPSCITLFLPELNV